MRIRSEHLMNFDLQRDALSRTLITAHRGVTGGNIPGNTLAAFDAALLQGADMIEIDVDMSRDGKLYILPTIDYENLMPAGDVRKSYKHWRLSLNFLKWRAALLDWQWGTHVEEESETI